MTSKRYVARSAEIAARRLGDEMMVMSGRDSTLFTLNEVATIIWEAADGSIPLHEIVESKVCPEFEVDPAEALRDANDLVEGLAARGILLLSDEPFRPSSIGEQLQ
jgi:Coenzyme PQQ synthesis protein D (PqqD)